MASAAIPDTAISLLSLHPEERRLKLLESLREGYPCISKVSRPVSSKVSRYVSQFTSGRWRERIWFSDDSDASEDMQCETETRETRASGHLVIFGYDLHSEDYLMEREMIARWNIVERELHFPDLEKGYVQKRDAKTQSDVSVFQSCQTPATQDVNIVQEPTIEDVLMEECQQFPLKLAEYSETVTTISGQESLTGVEELGSKVKKLNEFIEVPAEVIEQTSSCSVLESKSLGLDLKGLGGIETSPQRESANKSLVSNSKSSALLEGKESDEMMATVPEDSKADGGSEKKIETEAISLADANHGKTSVANSEDSIIPKESEGRKEVSTVPDSKLTDTSKIMTSESTSSKSGDKISAQKLQFLAALEVKESTGKIEAGTVLDDSKVGSSEKVMVTFETTSTESSSEKVPVPKSESSCVPEVKEPADKMEDETATEHSKIDRTSETDLETGTTLRGKRKADSLSDDDPDEKRTKKASVE